MKIIFGQGNPGANYAKTRHNISWMVLDFLAKKHEATFSSKPRFIADIAEATINGEKALLVKPSTFYNETGKSAHALIAFYKLNPKQDFLVIHDELALPFGTIKSRLTGSDGGNNGVKSLNTHLGSDYARLRIGIYNPLRDRMDDADFVLAPLSASEVKLLPLLAATANEFTTAFISGALQPTKTTVVAVEK